MSAFDPRLTVARPDLAARSLEGVVEAAAYVDGFAARVVEAVAPVRRGPRADASLDTEALFGEAVTVYADDGEGWAWVQLARDSYVGYMPIAAILPGAISAPTHRVSALRSFVFSDLTIKAPPLRWVSLGSEVTVLRETEANGRRFAVLADGGAMVLQHLARIDARAPDPVAVAEKFLGTPYLWGGKSSLGIDCSGLVQTAMRAAGHIIPRDSDQQEAVGREIGIDRTRWRRGDLLFWPGHVALVRDPDTILHANAHHMMVSIERTGPALARIEAAGSPLRSVRRLG